jgi:hypothetical protein
MFDLKRGGDYLLTQTDYLNRMLTMFNPDHASTHALDDESKEGSNNRSVYVLDIDKALYDVNDPRYTQVHCLRFEYERSTGFKITDVDFYLEGSRHARAHSEELLNSSSLKKG